MIDLLFITLFITAIVLFVGVCCAGCCCCFFGIPFYHIFFNSKSPSPFKSKSSFDGSSTSANINTAYASVPSDANAIPIAEAYIVPPLVAVHAESVRSNLDTATEATSISTSAPKAGYQDFWASALFVINFLVIFSLACNSYSKIPRTDESNSSHYSTYQISSVVFSILVVLGLASAVTWFAFKTVLHHAESIIEWSFILHIASLGISALISLVYLQLIGALILGLFTLLSYWFYLGSKDRIPFASAVLTTAASAVEANFQGLVGAIYGGFLCQILWVFLWSVAAYGTISHSENNNNGSTGFMMFYLVLSFYWGLQVINYVIGVTCGGSVACWWFQPQRPAPVRGSLLRAVTTSFGSICFGALIVAILQTLRFMLQQLKKAQNNRDRRDRNTALICLIAIADFILQMVEGLVLYFNRYAYAYIAAYGYDFLSSGKKVRELFDRRGFTALVNDNLIGVALNMLAVVVAAFSTFTGGVGAMCLSWTFGLDTSFYIPFGFIMGSVIGLVVGIIIATCLDNAVAMIFVCFAEDPLILETNHPNQFSSLRYQWELFNPSSIAWATAVVVANASETGAHYGDRNHFQTSTPDQASYAHPHSKSIAPSAPALPAHTYQSRYPKGYSGNNVEML